MFLFLAVEFGIGNRTTAFNLFLIIADAIFVDKLRCSALTTVFRGFAFHAFSGRCDEVSMSMLELHRNYVSLIFHSRSSHSHSNQPLIIYSQSFLCPFHLNSACERLLDILALAWKTVATNEGKDNNNNSNRKSV